MVRFISFMNKLEVLHAPRNLAETKIGIEQDYGAKVGEISKLIPYLRLQTIEKHNIPSSRHIGDLEILQENYQIQNTDKTFDNPLTEDHVIYHQSLQRQILEVNRQKESATRRHARNTRHILAES